MTARAPALRKPARVVVDALPGDGDASAPALPGSELPEA